jgi:phenylalanyl-tRNA synthetase beta chain
VAEEIARVHGYDRVPETLPDTTTPAYRPSPVETRDALREALVGAGLTEVVTHALVSKRHLEQGGWRGLEPAVAGEGAGGGAPIAVSNPLSQDHAWLRQSLVGSLLDVVATNVRRGRSDVAIFEAGKGYGLQDGAAVEWWRLGLALTGSFDEPNWSRPPRNADLADAKGLVEALCRRLGLAGPSYEPLTDEPLLHPGRAARVAAHAGGGALALSGRVGEVHPDALEAWELRIDRCVVAELAVAGLAAGQVPAARPPAPPRQPAVTRDVAIVVDAAPAGAVEAAVRQGAGDLLEDVVLFDVYVGPPLEPGERSLAYRLTFRAADRTLTEDEIESAVGRVVDAVNREVGGRIRR